MAMTPIINTANIYTPPPTLVATTIPGNNTLRVNANDVPPPVSNVEINNNSKGGNTAIPSAPNASAASAATSATFSLSPFIYTTPTSLSAAPQTTFFAQLMSQDASMATNGMLEQYEQMIVRSYVKYAPSNATLPEPEPSSVFARVLQQEREIQTTQRVTTQQVAQQTASTESIARSAAPVVAPKAPASTRSESASRPASTAKASAQSSVAPKAAAGAYLASIARVNTPERPKNSESLELI